MQAYFFDKLYFYVCPIVIAFIDWVNSMKKLFSKFIGRQSRKINISGCKNTELSFLCHGITPMNISFSLSTIFDILLLSHIYTYVFSLLLLYNLMMGQKFIIYI